MSYHLRQGFFIFRFRYWYKFTSSARKLWLKLWGMKFGTGVTISRLRITWPHKIYLGNNSIVETGVYFNYDGIYSPEPSIIIGSETFIGANCEFNISGKILIGKTCLIASGCKFIDHDHSTALGSTINIQPPSISPIVLGDDVWLGFNVTVLKGVTIGTGAVVAAGSVVTKNIGEYEIYAGVPAKFIKRRQ